MVLVIFFGARSALASAPGLYPLHSHAKLQVRSENGCDQDLFACARHTTFSTEDRSSIDGDFRSCVIAWLPAVIGFVHN